MKIASIKYKFILIFLVVSVLPVIAISVLFFQQTKKNIQKQTIQLLTLAADNAEGNIFTFFERQKVRTQDWSSDGHIRSEVETIIKTNDAKRALELSTYLRNKKMPLDKTVFISDIYNLSGQIIVSSEEKRIGSEPEDMLTLEKEHKFISARTALFGQTFISDIIAEEKVAHPAIPMFHLSVPIISLSTNEVVGVMINHILEEELNNIVSGKIQMELGALTGGGPNLQTLETYLINRDGLMITNSRFVTDAVLKQKVSSEPIHICLQDWHEFSGLYENYKGDRVYGASMCPRNQFWMLLTEVSEKEMLSGFYQAIKILIGIILGIVTLTTIIAIYWGQKLTSRISNAVTTVAKIGQGNLEARISVIGNDEIAQLSYGINQMTADLEKYGNDKIKSLELLKHKFIQIISHQMRTPLNSIGWNLELLISEDLGKLTKEQMEFIKITYEANKEIVRRVSDILTALDIEEGRIEISKNDTISLESIMASILSEYEKKYKTKDISCKYIPPESPLPFATVDAAKIRDVCSRLMDNSITYCPDKNGEITMRLLKTNGQLRFEISDNGIGVPMTDHDKIFARFYRATNAINKQPDSSGLGLAIAKYYIEQHGGIIGFTSEENKGSTFWFELPIK